MSGMFKFSLLIFSSLLYKIFATCPLQTIQGPSPSDCYQLFSKPENWIAAEENCVGRGGHLASIQDVFHNGFIDEQVQNLFYNAQEAWIGGNTLISPGNWKWSDNTSFGYTTWAKGQPSGNQSTCISMNSDYGTWNSRGCMDINLPYVCKINATNDNSNNCPTTNPVTCPTCVCPTCPAVQPCSPCKNGYTYHSKTGHCYKVYDQLSSDLGEERCNQDSAHLASIHSAEENAFIADLAFGGGGDFGGTVWIGLKYQDGYWQWTDKTPLDYTNYGCYEGGTDSCYFMLTTHYSDGCGDWYGKWDKNAHACNVILPQIVCKYTP